MALSFSDQQRDYEGEYGFLLQHSVTILNWKANVRSGSGNTRLPHLQRNQRPCHQFYVIKPHYRALNEPGMLSNGVIRLHDNAHPYTVNTMNTPLQRFRWEKLEHPSYSLDLSPYDFHVFGSLKRAIRGQRFITGDEVCVWTQAWI
ncbi:mariner Mos1 transposase [Trichonephila clavipes]|nr:mariner Mos1 transposase [Trichonephila clavipes]